MNGSELRKKVFSDFITHETCSISRECPNHTGCISFVKPLHSILPQYLLNYTNIRSIIYHLFTFIIITVVGGNEIVSMLNGDDNNNKEGGMIIRTEDDQKVEIE